MSSFHLTLYEFKENLSIQKNPEFSIVIYCRQDDINVRKELDFLNNLYMKHDLK